MMRILSFLIAGANAPFYLAAPPAEENPIAAKEISSPRNEITPDIAIAATEMANAPINFTMERNEYAAARGGNGAIGDSDIDSEEPMFLNAMRGGPQDAEIDVAGARGGEPT